MQDPMSRGRSWLSSSRGGRALTISPIGIKGVMVSVLTFADTTRGGDRLAMTYAARL